ncbi:PRKR-interacting protein 1 [Pyrus ussuriensis x Pyrus communis]|uniref:PRKR-interacting protein 1 n=1 Tax=Pyrus ussuriensis x Pyrus communis TaxID=2448454 RepID=A0A5N5FIT9_9ROSA|nr:PRKR-interacting protein 1 [Pyrus ussuriensis x Pyrus communis]
MLLGRPKDGDMQLVARPERKQAKGPDRKLMLPSRPPTTAGSTALVEYTPPVFKEEEDDLKIKLRRILENFPFASYQQMRRKEQDRIARMDADYQRRKEEAEFNMRREERLGEAEEKTAKKLLKCQKKNQRKKEKKMKTNSGGEEKQKEESSDDASAQSLVSVCIAK